MAVSLSCTSPDVILPPQVVIAAGTTSKDFTIVAGATAGEVTITVTIAGVGSKSGIINVT